MVLRNIDGTTTDVPRSVQEFEECGHVQASESAIRNTFNLAAIYPERQISGDLPDALS